jgi:hypothetical protein
MARDSYASAPKNLKKVLTIDIPQIYIHSESKSYLVGMQMGKAQRGLLLHLNERTKNGNRRLYRGGSVSARNSRPPDFSFDDFESVR